ncbi:S-adenosyl-L-methionine-dependent methyltransferase [Dichotomopilus funicola]|uniref:S-adenosyl-L-methionine-dependent methyltransferase n=1 Tax=Dichotomopilus funicola TaxID=1934379 RepID=A0AAN6UZ21_9PEZI|nr:S-adenosyl-L-methionine-dependent methyltransferase [Dichotomopilus funicola]
MTDLKTRLQASYDAIAPAYNAWAISNSALRLRFLNRLLELLPPPSQNSTSTTTSNAEPNNNAPTPTVLHALELGCGAGIPITQSLLQHQPHTFHITANDLSMAQIALAQEAVGINGEITASAAGRTGDICSEVTWIQGDMMQLQYPDQSFDVIIALYSVIHLPRTEQDVLLERIARWLRPGGLVLVNFGAESVEEDVMEDWMGQWMFSSGWGAEVALEKVKGTGLEVVLGVVEREEGVDAEFLWVIGRRVV